MVLMKKQATFGQLTEPNAEIPHSDKNASGAWHGCV
jgi:hypothetical protein